MQNMCQMGKYVLFMAFNYFGMSSLRGANKYILKLFWWYNFVFNILPLVKFYECKSVLKLAILEEEKLIGIRNDVLIFSFNPVNLS